MKKDFCISLWKYLELFVCSSCAMKHPQTCSNLCYIFIKRRPDRKNGNNTKRINGQPNLQQCKRAILLLQEGAKENKSEEKIVDIFIAMHRHYISMCALILEEIQKQIKDIYSTRDTNGDCNLTNERRYISMLCVYTILIRMVFDVCAVVIIHIDSMAVCVCLPVIDKVRKSEYVKSPKSSTISNLISRKWKSSSPLLFLNTTIVLSYCITFFRFDSYHSVSFLPRT